MTMKTTISPRDLELLSAYLDGQLDRRNQLKLEARLNREPHLNDILVDLERTRSLLRSATPIKAPRSFKLKPEMLPARRRPVYPVFQFASVMAAVLLMVVLVGDLALGRMNAAAPAAAPVAMESVERVEMEADPAPQGAAAPKMSPTPTAPAADAAQAEMPTGEALLFSVPMTASLPVTDTIAMATGEPAAGMLDSSEEAGTQDEVDVPTITPILLVEISLASLAVLLGLAALILRRKG